jgi:hypothetical protein
MLVFADRAQFNLREDELLIELDLFEGSIHLLEDEKKAKVKDPKAESQGEGSAEPQAQADPPADEPEVPPGAGRDDTTQAGSSAPEALPPTAEGAPEPGEPQAEVQEQEEVEDTARDYAVIEFKRLSKGESISPPEARTALAMRTSPELLEIYRDGEAGESNRFKALAIYFERIAISLQCFIFTLIGLPLAIWIKPTGKSVGIIIAGLVIAVFHIMMRTGYTMISSGNVFPGTLTIFSPSILFAILSIFLWRRTVRS